MYNRKCLCETGSTLKINNFEFLRWFWKQWFNWDRKHSFQTGSTLRIYSAKYRLVHLWKMICSPYPKPPRRPIFNPNLERSGIGIGSGINRQLPKQASLDVPLDAQPRTNSLVQERMEKRKKEKALEKKLKEARSPRLSRWSSVRDLNSSDDETFTPFLRNRKTSKGNETLVVQVGDRKSTYSLGSPPTSRSRLSKPDYRTG